MDGLFGDENWRPSLLRKIPLEEKMRQLPDLYKRCLNTWFRYVLPLPFEPKPNQTYHLFICSNYEAGIRITWDFYVNYTRNPRYSPNNKAAYARFMSLKQDRVKQPIQRTRPEEWRILWQIIKNHHEGLCDVECEDLKEIQPDPVMLKEDLEWLFREGYLKLSESFTNAWSNQPTLFRLDWDHVKKDLDVNPPTLLRPLKPR